METIRARLRPRRLESDANVESTIFTLAILFWVFCSRSLLADEAPREIKITQLKFETEVFSALTDGRAELASFGICEDECHSKHTTCRMKV